MGRHAAGTVVFGGNSGAGKLLLEGAEVLCRGEIKARLTRDEIESWTIEGEDLVLLTRQGPLRATLGAREAAAWIRALSKPPPSLTEKLGLSDQSRAYAPFALHDDTLRAAVTPHLTTAIETAAMAIAELRSAADLNTLLGAIGPLPLWGVTVKGKSSPFSDAALRTALRAQNYVDTKSCAVSDLMTATRWQRRAV